MTRLDYIIVLTKGLLEAPEEIESELLDYFGGIFEITELRKPEAVSLGVGLDNGAVLSFATWYKSIRSEQDVKCKVRSLAYEIDALPEHIAAAFSGTQEYLVEVITEHKSQYYIIKSTYSSQYEMTVDLFIEWVKAQKNKEELLQLITEIISDSNQLNGRKGISKESLYSYLHTAEGIEVFEMLASNLLEEIQIECIVTEIALEIPEYLKYLFFKYVFKEDVIEEDPVVYLYPERKVTGKELITLICAQKADAIIWKLIQEDLEEYPLDLFPLTAASELEDTINSLTDEVLYDSGLVFSVCNAIRKFSKEQGIRPIIPFEIKEAFSPSDKEYDKAVERGMSNRWYLQSNKKAWEFYLFEPVAITMQLDSKEVFEQSKQAFLKALSDIELFAHKINSPLEEAFRLSHYFLSDEVPNGDFNENHLSEIVKDIISKGFLFVFVEIVNNNFFYIEEWNKMKYNRNSICGLFALTVSDVFGGMGSWNDQYVDEYPEEFERISSQTFMARKKYFIALMSN